MKPLLKKEFHLYLKNPATYISFAIFFLLSFARFFLSDYNSDYATLKNIFSFVNLISIIVIPALTMNLWSEETEITKSFPISNFKLVISKLIASSAMFLAFNILFFLSLYIFFFKYSLHRFSTSFFVLCFYTFCASSLCIFVTVATKNNIVSFVISTIALSLSALIHLVAATLNMPIKIAKFLNFFSFYNHFDSASKAVLDTRDIFFYLFLTCLFVTATIYFITLNKKKKKFIRALCFTFVLCILNSSVIYSRKDFSPNKNFSLSKHTENLIDSLSEQMRINWYYTSSLNTYFPSIKDIKDFLYLYTDNKNVSLEIFYADKDNSATKTLSSYSVYPQRISSSTSNKKTELQVYSAIILEYGSKTELIPFLLDTSTLEYDIAVRLEYFLSDKKNICQLYCGNGLSFESEYSYIAPCLSSSGINSYIIESTEELIDNVPLVVLGCTKMTNEDVQNIDNFLQTGGSAFFSITPYNVDISKEWTVTPAVNSPLINYFSLQNIFINREMIVSEENCITLNFESHSSNSMRQIEYPFFIEINAEKFAIMNPITLFWPSSIRASDSDLSIVAKTLRTSQKIRLPGSQIFDASPFETEKNLILDKNQFDSYNVSIVKNTNSGGKIIIVSDAYFLSTANDYIGNLSNFDFLSNCILSLLNKDSLIEIKAKHYEKY